MTNPVSYGQPQAQFGSASTGTTLVQDGEHALKSSLMWSTRIATGKLGDGLWDQYKDKNSTAAVAASGGMKATNYADILGLKEGASVKSNLQQLKPGVFIDRVRNGNINGGGQMTAGRFAKETLWGNNVKGIADIKNNPGTGIAKSLGLGMLGYGVFKDTQNAYDNAEANGENATASATVAFVGSAAKAGVSWEVSNVLYDVGRTMFPKATIGRVPLAGVVMGAVGAVMTAHALDQIIPKPGKPGETVASPDASLAAVQNTVNQGNPFNQSASQPASQPLTAANGTATA